MTIGYLGDEQPAPGRPLKVQLHLVEVGMVSHWFPTIRHNNISTTSISKHYSKSNYVFDGFGRSKLWAQLIPITLQWYCRIHAHWPVVGSDDMVSYLEQVQPRIDGWVCEPGTVYEHPSWPERSENPCFILQWNRDCHVSYRLLITSLDQFSEITS